MVNNRTDLGNYLKGKWYFYLPTDREKKAMLLPMGKTDINIIFIHV